MVQPIYNRSKVCRKYATSWKTQIHKKLLACDQLSDKWSSPYVFQWRSYISKKSSESLSYALFLTCVFSLPAGVFVRQSTFPVVQCSVMKDESLRWSALCDWPLQLTAHYEAGRICHVSDAHYMHPEVSAMHYHLSRYLSVKSSPAAAAAAAMSATSCSFSCRRTMPCITFRRLASSWKPGRCSVTAWSVHLPVS